jgi:SSS family solute:Na+ symporter/sodium/pantothenate symporter
MTGAPDASILAALLVFIAASVWLGTAAQRAIREGSFLTGYFLGNRGLGVWAMALTATVQSGGTFMGFPSLVYSHGWIVALWIAGYMVVPLTGFGVLGKRIAQLSRRTGAITVPELFRERFGSPRLGLVSSLLIIVFMGFMMVAQFKAGALVMKLAWPSTGFLSLAEDVPVETPDLGNGAAAPASKPKASGLGPTYYIGLIVFSLTVIGYTLIGGFLASVWTDLFQSVMMLLGVLILFVLTVPAAGGMQAATVQAAAQTGPEFAFGPGYGTGREFLPLGLAISFFFTWPFAGVGSPASMVRVMAAQRTDVLRRSIVVLGIYNCLIYIPLVMICIAGRALIPNLEHSDEIIPRLALTSTRDIPGGSLLAGLVLAAPFGAVMATVSCYLLVIASGLVQDLYLRFWRPDASVKEIRRVTYAAMTLVGCIAIAANIRPASYLQAIVVFSGTSAAATFVVPALMACYWRRATAAGVLAAMLSGAGTMFCLFGIGWIGTALEPLLADDSAPAILQWCAPLIRDPKIGIAGFRPYFLLGMDPIVWGLAASAVVGVLVSLTTSPPEPERIARYFDRTDLRTR